MSEPAKIPVKAEAAEPARAPQAAAPKAPAHTDFFTPLDTLRREIDRVFDSFHLGGFRLPFGRANEIKMPHDLFGISPVADLTDKGKEFELTLELPGVEAKDVNVKVSNGVLTIRGEKKETKEEREKDYYLSERRYGSFMRSFPLPEGVDVDKINAAFNKGVLTLKLPKTVEAQKNEKQIEVKAA